MGVEERQHRSRHRERDPARADGQQQAFALVVRKRRLSEFQGVLLDLGFALWFCRRN